jgi:uncharacterized protein (TIGR03435 family)
MRIWLGLLLIAAAGADVVGQAPPQPASTRPAFEAASIKKRLGPGPASVIQGQNPTGRFDRTITAAGLILYGYDLRDYQLAGGPDWLRTDRFDVAATAGRSVSVAELRLMVQSLLAERFKLTTHQEQREMPIHTLVLARKDGRLGPAIARADDDCRATAARPAKIPAGAGTTSGCGDAAIIARSASTAMGSPVVDRTGLTGRFVYFMFYALSGPRALAGTVLPLPDTSGDPNLPSYPTALQEQLGLELEATRGPVDVLVIDSVQQPTEN